MTAELKTELQDGLFSLDDPGQDVADDAGTPPGFRLHRLELLNWGTFHQGIRTFRLDGANSLLTGDIRPSVAEHDAIIEAIEAGNADEAQIAVQTNWRHAADRIGKVIEVAGERGSW